MKTLENTPDNWVVLKIEVDGVKIMKLLMVWSGGYLDGDAWRMNSGITEVKGDSDGNLFFYGHSGSCYTCHPNTYRLTMAIAGVYNQLKEQFGDAVELMPEDTDWRGLDYE